MELFVSTVNATAGTTIARASTIETRLAIFSCPNLPIYFVLHSP
jgi:hypothetical protein